MNGFNRFVYIGFLLLSSCNSEDTTPEGLKQYIVETKNGLIQRAEANGYSLEVVFKPSDLFVLQEIKANRDDSITIASLKAKYDPYYYFILNVSINGAEALAAAGNLDEYGELVQTMSYKMREFVNVSTALDTIVPVEFLLERTYGMANSTSLMFVFEKAKLKDSDWIQFNVNEFGLGSGNERFLFKAADLENVPRLKFTFR